MSLFQIFNAFEKYSIDILFLALIVVIITSFVKKTVFKNKHKKIVTFVPFIAGIAVYILYMYFLKNTDIKSLITSENIRNGFITGGISTVYYVFYEQFIREKRSIAEFSVSELAVEGILSAIVLKDNLESCAKEITSEITERLTDKSYCI